MKKFVLLTSVLFFVIVKAKTQLVINEIYTDPGSGNHEFFELYNTSTSSIPFSLDNYTLVTFFDISGQKGFYVMDLPNLTINPMGFFVGSSASPFNFQGATGSTATDFNWNSALLVANNGYLKKWVRSSLNLLDGNLYYDQQSIPANFNDFFYRRMASGASYTIFLYNNGLLINTFVGGTGGNATIINDIVNMPQLFVNMASPASTDFTINFSGYGSVPLEYCIQDAGSDNGFIREKDGGCNFWNKSSASVQHTPKQTNGGVVDQFSGNIAVSSSLTQGNAIAGSSVTYEVVSAPAGAFPVELQLFRDIGTVAGKLDAADTFIEAKTQNSLEDPAYTTIFFPYDVHILIVVKSSVGCIDKIQSLANSKVLTHSETNFYGNRNDENIILNWVVTQNEVIDRFELEKSENGKDFTSIALITGTDAMGTVHYSMKDNKLSDKKLFYRIKIIEINQKIKYSTVISIEAIQKNINGKNIVVTNPVKDKLIFSFPSITNETAILKVYDLNGRKVIDQPLKIYEGNNIINISLSSSFKNGMYISEIISGVQQYNFKFVKQ